MARCNTTTVALKPANVVKEPSKAPSKTKGKASVNKVVMQVDERTANLSEKALFCRTYGHKWGVIPIGAARHAELLRQGLTETHRECEHGCGSTWWELWEVSSGNVVDFERKYATAIDEAGQYRMPKGTGRLPRAEARKANFARQFPDVVSVAA